MNEKNKRLVDKQIQLIDKQIKAVPRTLTNDQIQILLLEREKLVTSKITVGADSSEEKDFDPSIKTGLKAMTDAVAFGGGRELDAATALTVGIAGMKIFKGVTGLFKKKKDSSTDETVDETPVVEEKYKEPEKVKKPVKKKPGFLMTAEDKIRERAERMEKEKSGAPEKTNTSKEDSSDNTTIISILNKILKSFESDNDRMRRSIRGEAENKLEADPTPDIPGGPVKEGDDKKSGMNKLLMFGAIAGLLATAYTFKDEIAKILEPITDMLGITNPLKDAEKEDYDFDIMDALGVTALLGMLGVAAAGPGRSGGATAAGRAGGATAAGRAAATSGTPAVDKPGFLKTQEERIRERGARIAAERGSTTTSGTPERPNAGSNARPRHPAGTVINGKKVGGQFMKVEKATITSIIKKSVGKVAGKIIPGLGLALGLYDAYSRAKEGDFVGAAIAAGGGGAALIPGIGTGVAIAAAASNIARDVYKEAYGVFPEDDESGEKAQRAKDIMDEILKEMTGTPYVPMTDTQKKTLEPFLQAYRDVASDPRPIIRQGAKKKLIDAGLKAGIPRDALMTELGDMRAEATGKLGGEESLKALQDSAATAKTDSSAETATAETLSAGGAPAGRMGGATAEGRAVAASSDMSSASGSPVPSAPPPASETSGNAVTAATMNASEAQSSVTVLPPIVNNETNNMRTGDQNGSKAQKVKMQVRLQDDTFRSAIEATAARPEFLKAA